MPELPTVLTTALETAINGVLKLDPDTLARLDKLSGKVIAIELKGLDIKLYLIPVEGGINVFGRFDGEPDAVISGAPLSMMRMGLEKRAEDSLFHGDVEIQGDVELGQAFRDILDGLDIDWEEQLSMLTGDVVAHKVGEFVRGTVAWGKKAVDTLGRDAAEYVQEESRDVVNQFELEGYMSQVDELRSDVDRMEARIKRLRSSFEEKHDGGGER
jgi:ubiquinone biosynthesis protein UbiJ